MAATKSAPIQMAADADATERIAEIPIARCRTLLALLLGAGPCNVQHDLELEQ